MNFQHCRYVDMIAKTGSFSEAAKVLFVTQPNLSSSVRDLENELGVQLFTRSNTGAKLTDDGHDFLKYARRILGELDLLEGRYRKGFKKSFTVASHHYDFLSLPLATIAAQFQDDYQEFQLIETTTNRILESVANFESDLGIIYINEDNRHIMEHHLKDKQLSFTPLGDFQTRIFLKRDHPLANHPSLSNADLKGYPQVRFRQDKSGITFDEDPLDVLEEQQVLYANDRGTVMNLLCSTDAYASGLGIVSSFIKDQIVLIPLSDSPLHTLGIVTNQKQKTSTIADAFIQEVQHSLTSFKMAENQPDQD